MDIYQVNADALILEDPACLDGFPYHMAAGENADVSAFRELLGLADPEIGFQGEDGPGGPAEPQVNRALVGGNGFCGGLGLVVIAGNNDGHARQHFHQSDIFQDLVGGAVLTQSEARMRCADLHILSGVGDGLADLVIDPAGGEIGEGGGVGDLAAYRQPRGDTHHIGFGYPHLVEAVREFLDEGAQFKGSGEVRAERDHVGVLFGDLVDAISEAASRIFLAGDQYVL